MSTGACSEQVHRNFISPPSLWPGRELRAYHCPSCASWRNAGATRILLLVVLTANQTDRRSTQLECTGSGLFDFQGAGKHRGCPYTSKYGQLFRSIHSPTKKFKKCRLQISRNRHSPQILNFEMLSAICMRMYCFRSSSKRPYK